MQTELPMAMSDQISWISNPTIDFFAHDDYQPIEFSHNFVDEIQPIHSISYVITPPEQDPCTTGLAYGCFSKATAKQCQQVCILIDIVEQEIQD